jgi:glycosyltransferase involved in cell wall biosynthesis
MSRVIVLNNYPLDTVWQAVRDRETPDHLLFGVNFLADAGWDVRLVPFADRGFGHALNRFFRRSPVPLGDLQQQVQALQWLNECDLVYSPCQTQAHALSYFRALGVLRRPIVCLAHHVMNRGRLTWLRAPFLHWQLRGTDAFPSLSRAVAAEINAVVPGKSETIAWGPDSTFYPTARSPGRGVLAVGRTGRDFVTFGVGATRSGRPARIICLDRNVLPEFHQFARNVEVRVQPNQGWMTYRELVGHYATARAVGIPLDRQVGLAGLSTLVDTLAMGRPVLMTRHPLIDIDIEAAGIGRWVDVGDIDGWSKAITWIDDNPDEAMAMGKRARRLVDDGLNSLNFAGRLLQVFDRVLGERR